MPQPLTPHLIEQAKLMRIEGASWFRIAKTLDVREYSMRCALDPDYRIYKREIWAQRRRTEPKRQRPKVNHAVQHAVRSSTHLAPPEVLAERELALELRLQARSITAELQGDPLPGRSALDQRSRKC